MYQIRVPGGQLSKPLDTTGLGLGPTTAILPQDRGFALHHLPATLGRATHADLPGIAEDLPDVLRP